MARNRRRIFDEIQRIEEEYIPDVGCKGQCQHSCGPIDVSLIEQEFITKAGGPTIPPQWVGRAQRTQFNCPALGDDGRCIVYDVRPVVCRIWGATEGLECPHGCRPTGGAPLLPLEDGMAILSWVMQFGGGIGGQGKYYDSRLGHLTSLEHAFERARQEFGPGGRHREMLETKAAAGLRAESTRRYRLPPS